MIVIIPFSVGIDVLIDSSGAHTFRFNIGT